MSGHADVASWQRRLLPGEFLTAPGGPRSARDWVVDVVLIGFALILGVIVLTETWDEHGTALKVVDAGVGAACCASLWWRRSRPLAVAMLAVLGSAVSGAASGAVLVAFFNAAVRLPPRIVLVLLAVGLPGGVLYAALYPNGATFDWTGLVIGILLTILAVSWGLFVRARRVLILSLRERAERLEAEQ